MARIRTIKPEFFTSEDIVNLTPLSRLFYVSLWCESDRDGRLEWKPGTFKMRYFPGDNCDIATMGKELTSSGLVVLYEVDGKTFAEIPTFKEHQVINNRDAPSLIPARVKVACARVKAEGKEGRKGMEGNGKEGKEGVGARGSRLPTTFEPDFQFAVDAGIQNTLEEANKFRDYWNSQPGQKGVKLDWQATWRNWCRNSKPSAPSESFKERDDRNARKRWEAMTGMVHPDNIPDHTEVFDADHLMLGVSQ